MRVSTARGDAGVGEAPRHEVAGLGHDGATRYGVLMRTPVFVEFVLAQQMRETGATSSWDRRLLAFVTSL